MEKLKNIVLIGPVYPYKGGIAHYTGLLYKNLSKKYHITAVSYKLQYPKFLYKKEQMDFSNDTLKIEDAQFLINSANPFNWIKTARTIKKMSPQMVIIQWWHPYFAPCYWTMRKFLGKTKVIYSCHNVFPHERFPMDRLLTKMVLKNGDGFIVHSEKDAADLKSIKRNAKYRKTVLPSFSLFNTGQMSRVKARKLLNINADDKVILFFGLVRPYKGLQYLLKAFARIRNKENTKLMIAGSFGGDKQAYMDIIAEEHLQDRVIINDAYIPDTEVEKYFQACNLVVLPYVSATQSAVVQTAFDFEKPVIVTNVGGLPEVVLDGKTGFVVPAEDPDTLAKKIDEYFEKDKEQEFVKNIRSEAYKYSWDRMRECIEKLYTTM